MDDRDFGGLCPVFTLPGRLRVYLIALGLGLASGLTFLLGILGHLSLGWLWIPLLLFLLTGFGEVWFSWPKLEQFFSHVKKNRLELALVCLLIILGLVYSLRLWVPEISFDALWYHLTLPKLYLQEGRVRFFPGGLLYYSAMPQAMEMIYLLGLVFQGQILARSFHWLFGVLSALVTYQLARRFVPSIWALTAALIFYSQLTVGWLSSAAYVDLTRTFLETLALLALLNWVKRQEGHWLLAGGVVIGLATTVKLLSLGPALVMVSLIFWQSKQKIRDILVFLNFFGLMLVPWILYSKFETGSWFYPFLNSSFQQNLTIGQGLKGWFVSRTPLAFIRSVWRTAFTQGDILSPVFLIGLPCLFVSKIYKKRSVRVLGVYVVLNFWLWFLTPVNYNRFLLPLTPVLSVLLVVALSRQNRTIQTFFQGVIILVAGLHLGIAVILSQRLGFYLSHKLSQQEYLDNYLKSNLGNFGKAYQFLEEKVRGDRKILVVGGHNLFYVPVDFDHETWDQKSRDYSYVLVQNEKLPGRFAEWSVVFKDQRTDVTIYSKEIDESID